MTRPLVIAIDGPAGSGKGTLAAALALRFSLAHLDTGRIYRAAAAVVLRAGGDPADARVAAAAARGLDFALLGDPGLRDEAVGNAASVVAGIPEVRAALLEWQRNFAAHPPAPAQGAGEAFCHCQRRGTRAAAGQGVAGIRR
jgi:cytidylate kinase